MSYKCECGTFVYLEKWILDNNHNNCDYCLWKTRKNFPYGNELIDAICFKVEQNTILYYNFNYSRSHIEKHEYKNEDWHWLSTFKFDYDIDNNIDNLPIVVNLIKKFKDNLIFA